jgi:hypothetical protein
MGIPKPMIKLAAVAIVALALMPALWILASNRDIPQFGTYQDDGLFLIGAKSLSEHRGYRMLNLPGEPYQTKYQPLHAWLLAAIWSINGSFPGNLVLVSMYQSLAMVAFIAVSAFLFRSFGFSALESAALAAFLALSPWIIYWATVPFPDYLFTALVAGTFVLLHHAQQKSRGWFLAAGVMAMAAYLTKPAGLLLVPAVLIKGFRRRDWRSLALFLAPVLPAAAVCTLWANARLTPSDQPILQYYTGYVGAFFKGGALAALPDIIPHNLTSLITALGTAVIQDLPTSMPGRFLCVLIAAAVVSGTVRISKRTGRVEYPVFCLLLALTLSVCYFSPTIRLMLPLLPLLAMGLYAEGAVLIEHIARSVKGQELTNRITAYGITAAAVVGCLYGLHSNGRFIVHDIPALLQQSREWTVRRREVFRWCRASLPASAVVLASDDTLFYLYTGRKSVKPVPNGVAFYTNDHAGMIANFTHLDEVTRAFGITHILINPGDYETEFEPADRQQILKLLLDDPKHRSIYSADGFTVLEVEPSGVSAGFEPFASRP